MVRGESGCVTYANDPVDAGVPADGRVGGVNADHLVPLEGTVGVHPVRVQHTEVSEGTSNLLLSNGLDVLLVLQLVHTRGLRLTVADTTVSRPLASSTADLWGGECRREKHKMYIHGYASRRNRSCACIPYGGPSPGGSGGAHGSCGSGGGTPSNAHAGGNEAHRTASSSTARSCRCRLPS